MSQALYRKYRSKNLKEVVGQKHIVDVLTSALKQDKISHAYLFTGPRGVGKTSIARIFAHEINKEEYQSEKTHLDIIEIDAASNSGVDDMRDLREKINSAPAGLKYKVYIIDEVHMLSGASFAALLKTIEEPPSHAIFILATTDVHKVPATILSRVQKFYFKPIEQKEMVKHLDAICKKEKIDFEEPALEIIAEASEGSMRDALSLLDQVASGNKSVSLKSVQSSLGLSQQKELNELCDSITNGQTADIPSKLQDLIASGVEPRALALQIYQALKSKLDTYDELETLGELLTLGSLTKPALGLEINLLKLSALISLKKTPQINTSSNKPPIAALVETLETVEDKITVSNKEIKEISQRAEPVELKPSSESTRSKKSDKVAGEVDSEVDHPEDTDSSAQLEKLTLRNFSEKWSDILDAIAQKSPSLKAVLKPSAQKLTEKTYSLDIKMVYPIHLKMLSESKNKQVFKEAFMGCSIKLPKLDFTLADKKTASKQSARSEDNNRGSKEADLSDIIGLMGGGEAIQI